APVLQEGPGGDVRPGGPVGTEGDLLGRLGAGRVGARPGIRGQAARLHPAAAPGREEDPESGIGFASGNWRRVVCDRRRPGMVERRHFEAMVFCYLAEELRTGDIAVIGSNEYADWSEIGRAHV